MSKCKYKPGDVVWALVADRSGIEKQNARPLLVIAPPAENSEQHLCCLCASTRRENDSNDESIELPWDCTSGSTTGIYEFCAIFLGWFILLEQCRVTKKSGSVSKTFLAEVIERRARYLSKPR